MQMPTFSLLLSVALLPALVMGLIPEDGSCVLNTFVPFTARLNVDVGQPQMTEDIKVTSSSFLTSTQDYSLGFYHMAAALLAMEDFNTARNNNNTPELTELTRDCTIQFDMERSMFLDTSTIAHLGTTSLIDEIESGSSFPCAIAGPFNDLAAQNMAVIAAAGRVPHIPMRGYNYRLSDRMYSPFTSLVFPDMIVIGEGVGLYLQHINRRRYVAVMHTASADTGAQRGQGIGIGMQKVGVEEWDSFAYATPLWYMTAPGLEIEKILGNVKKRGYRTIVVAMEVYYLELPYLADAAEALGMNNGDYVWVFNPSFEMEAVYNILNASDELLKQAGLPSFGNVTKLLRGAALVQPVEPYQYLGETDPFWKAWKSRDSASVERLNNAYFNNSVTNGSDRDKPAGDDFFQTQRPQLGTAFMYDAVLSIGIGACLAQKREQAFETSVSGISHLEAIQDVDFSGASGRVAYDRGGRNTREPTTATIGVFNLFPPVNIDVGVNGESSQTASRSFEDEFVLTEIVTNLHGPGIRKKSDNSSSIWTQIGSVFIFANGRTTPPELLRDPPEQNYLSRGLHIAGLTLMSVALTAAAASMAWVLVHWQARVVRASQPYLLCVLLFGAMLSSLALLTQSWDESYGWSPEKLSTFCMAGPWCFAIGFMIIYGALFTKLWAINKVLQFRRRKISANRVAAPMAILIALAMIVLTIWTIHDPLHWERTELDSATGESIGGCTSGSGRIYLPMLVILAITPACLTCLMAWKTRDVDDIYSESSWIFTLVVLQIQVIIVGVPVSVILAGESTDGKYLGLSVMLWTIPMSTIGLIIVPKIVSHHRGDNTGPVVKRGAPVGVRISGWSNATSFSKKADLPPVSDFDLDRSSQIMKLHDSYQTALHDTPSEQNPSSNDAELKDEF